MNPNLGAEGVYQNALNNKDKNAEAYHKNLILAANLGYDLAKDDFYDYYYGQLSTLSFKPYPIDFSLAKEFYELSIKSCDHNSYSAFLLGEMYGHGKGVLQDYGKAKELYELAIKNDDANTFAYWNLALIYDHGLGVDKNPKLSKKYYDLSIDNARPYSYYRNACNILESSNKKDWKKAEKELKTAIMLGRSTSRQLHI